METERCRHRLPPSREMNPSMMLTMEVMPMWKRRLVCSRTESADLTSDEHTKIVSNTNGDFCPRWKMQWWPDSAAMKENKQSRLSMNVSSITHHKLDGFWLDSGGTSVGNSQTVRDGVDMPVTWHCSGGKSLRPGFVFHSHIASLHR